MEQNTKETFFWKKKLNLSGVQAKKSTFHAHMDACTKGEGGIITTKFTTESTADKNALARLQPMLCENWAFCF